MLVQLIDIKKEDTLISHWLINNNYAFEYDGGKKKSWESFLNSLV